MEKRISLAQQQKNAKIGQDLNIIDESLQNFKKPNADLDVKQRIASTGETVPIVFGKRVNNIGGVWVQPSLLKAGTFEFRQSYLFAISQGEIVGTPNKATSYTGVKKILLLNDNTITTTNIYNSAETLAANPNTCPIQGTGLFCGYENYSFLNPVMPASSGFSIGRHPDIKKEHFIFNILTVGEGDTSNTSYTVDTEVFDAETGANLTANVQAGTISLTTVSSGTTFSFNVRGSGAQGLDAPTLGGFPVGNVVSLISITNGLLSSPHNPETVAAGLTTQADLDKINAINNGKSNFFRKFTFSSLNTQVISTNPPSTGTLTGCQLEWIVGNRSDINSYTDLDNSSYADITFLSISGQLFESPFEGTYPTETKQVYVFYDQGVKVDLYSAGLSGSSYTQGASNQFLDLAMYLFTIYKKIEGNNTASIVAPVEVTNLQSLSTFCTNNNMFFNGTVSKSVNIIDYITTISPYYFLLFLSVGGKYKFMPILPLNSSNQFSTSAITPITTFREANIIPGTLQKTFLSVEEKRDFIANCIYNECSPAEISKQKTVTVRFTTTTNDAPTEQFDMSDFCVNVDHAILYAKFELSRRKHSTHSISFSSPLITTTLIPTNIIKVELQRKNSVGDDRTETNFYQVDSITYDNDGVSNIDATHFPLNNSNVSAITNEMLTGSFSILQ